MSRLKFQVPLVLAGLGCAALALEIAMLRREQMRAGRICTALEQRKQEHDRLLRQAPAPTVENEKAVVAALDEAARTAAALRAELFAPDEPATGPESSVDAFIDLGRFEEEMRQKAAGVGVTVGPAEHFGFAGYAHEGPEAALLPTIHRQRTEAGSIIAALLEARPLALLAVKRERPGAAGDNKPGEANEDYFTLPRAHSVRQPGLVDADAFRLEFTGQTAVLRQFLNALAGSARPVVVRTVEVEPLRETRTAPGQAGTEAETLHRPQISKFAVTVEIPLIVGAGGTP